MSLVIDTMPELGVTRVSRWCFNTYLLNGDDGALIVVDPGMPRVVEDLAPLIASTPATVAIVTATHGHPDHVGGAAAVAQRYGAEIHLPATTLSYLHGANPRTPTLAKLARTWPLLFGQPFDIRAATGFVRASTTAGFGTSRGMLWPGAPPAGALSDQTPLPGASSWSVLHTPGHTDDHIALWHAGSGTLLSGDAVITMRGQPRFAPDTVDDDAANTTRARLQALPVQHLLPGHGRPIHTESAWKPPC